MQRKTFVLFAGLVLLSLLIAPAGMADAQVKTQISAPDCPPFDPTLIRDKGVLQSLPPECAKSYQKLTQDGGNQADQPDITPLAVGGPDAFGYTWNDTVADIWISASTDSGIVGDDVSSGPIPIGFNFPFYGLPQTQLYFNTNGLITFGLENIGYGGGAIPTIKTPNNFIAPFWEDLLVGGPSGAVYLQSGGSAPDRYFVVEWRDVTTYNGSSAFSFEAILYENGDIVVQHQSLPVSYSSTVGIENSVGDEGLQYQSGSSGLSAPKAIRFYYPTTPTAHVLISPLDADSFTTPGGNTNFAITVTNPGSLGADTYDLTAASTWPVSFYAADGVTPLTDTDSDGTVDTGSVSQGSAVTITAKVATPGGATVGANSAAITAYSSLDTSKSKTASLQSAVPAPFAQIYKDNADGAMSLDLVQPNAQVVKKATADGYNGYNMAVAAAPNGNFVYLWTNPRSLGSVNVREIEYTLLDRHGQTVRAVNKLTDNSGATMDTYDYLPSVAIAPNGRMGVAWYRYLYNSATSQFNYNIYFATLDVSGNLVTGPTNITNNTIWGTSSDLNFPIFYNPTIAATDDNRFVLGWRKRVDNPYAFNIWYATRDPAGLEVFAPAALTSDDKSGGPVLNSLTGGQAILTWNSDGIPTYAVLNSSGGISKAATTLGISAIFATLDAVLLPNSKVALAWPTDTGVQFAILNSSYSLESGPTSADSPYSAQGYALSIATDSSSRVIMTWVDGTTNQNLFYALGDSAGTFITAPMVYKQSSASVETSYNGQGNVSYGSGQEIYLPLIMR